MSDQDHAFCCRTLKDENASLRTALTESRREVEVKDARYKRMVSEMLERREPNQIVTLFGVPIEQYADFLGALTMLSPHDAGQEVLAENATLRRQVEEQAAVIRQSYISGPTVDAVESALRVADDTPINKTNGDGLAFNILASAARVYLTQGVRISDLESRVEEQAGKLAEARAVIKEMGHHLNETVAIAARRDITPVAVSEMISNRIGAALGALDRYLTPTPPESEARPSGENR